MKKVLMAIAIILSSAACSDIQEMHVQKEINLVNYNGAVITIEAEEGSVCEISGCAYNDKYDDDKRCMQSSGAKGQKHVQSIILTKSTTDKYEHFMLDYTTKCTKNEIVVDSIITIEARGL